MSTRQPTTRQLEQRTLVGERIRFLRHQRGYSQERLAELAGMDRQSVGHYERAQRAATVDDLTAIADALGVAPWRFFYG
ncbi:helix-turn-helix domain-containing protein [Streptomyces sp. NRRL B-24484]|uniref:helix-turn-helix domain-containing protein n=1 Tax=Streptomyces sp. NRRL B-24484 TaxID=1463833 RepID=UPI001F161A81|nr:helix-turn-helix transcriptional regulator [Streptomyces sp. NRRL B-24484]